MQEEVFMRSVTTVIPTRGRPDLLRRAIDSALAQLNVDNRIIVVIDGPRDPASEAVVSRYHDGTVSALTFEVNQGPALCRMAGARAAQTDWIAFLDDDDHWHPDKLRRQLAAVPKGEAGRTIVSCQSHVVTPSGTYCWPRRIPRPGERVGDYLFCRHSLFKGESFLQASSFLCSRALLTACPMEPVAHEDWDWVLKACERDGNRLVVVSSPLLHHYAEFRRDSLSNRHDFRKSLAWCLGMRRIISRQAFAGLLLQTLNGALTEKGDWRGGLRLLHVALRHGKPRVMDLGLFLGQWLFPVRMRRGLRAMATGSSASSGVEKP
jgi:glycosyltransferase involved in cell wall biosynthesis